MIMYHLSHHRNVRVQGSKQETMYQVQSAGCRVQRQEGEGRKRQQGRIMIIGAKSQVQCSGRLWLIFLSIVTLLYNVSVAIRTL